MSMEEQTVNFVLVEDMETKLQFSMNEIRISFHDASLVQGKYNQALGQTSAAACVNCPVGLYLDTTNDDNFANNGGTAAHLPPKSSCEDKAITGHLH